MRNANRCVLALTFLALFSLNTLYAQIAEEAEDSSSEEVSFSMSFGNDGEWSAVSRSPVKQAAPTKRNVYFDLSGAIDLTGGLGFTAYFGKSKKRASFSLKSGISLFESSAGLIAGRAVSSAFAFYFMPADKYNFTPYISTCSSFFLDLESDEARYFATAAPAVGVQLYLGNEGRSIYLEGGASIVYLESHDDVAQSLVTIAQGSASPVYPHISLGVRF